MASRGEERRKARGENGGEMTKFYWILGAVAVIGIGIVGYSVGSNTLGTAATMPVDVEGLDDMERLVELAQGVTRGDPSAPITIVEFGDFQCPGCGQFALQVKPQVDLTYVQSGQAKFVFYDYPLVEIGHQHAFLAARAARCAGDLERYWEYHDALFRNQSSWSSQTQVAGTFVEYAEQLGLDTELFEACLRSDRHADVVTANMRLGRELGVNGTPTIMISEGRGMARRLQSYGFPAIQSAIEEIRAEGAGR